MNQTVSDETLHAFVDGELDVAESEKLIARMRENEALAQRVCNLRSLKSMVQLAYAVPPHAGSTQRPWKAGGRPARCFSAARMPA
jgi:anti-sigma factor RsiW